MNKVIHKDWMILWKTVWCTEIHRSALSFWRGFGLANHKQIFASSLLKTASKDLWLSQKVRYQQGSTEVILPSAHSAHVQHFVTKREQLESSQDAKVWQRMLVRQQLIWFWSPAPRAQPKPIHPSPKGKGDFRREVKIWQALSWSHLHWGKK